MKKGFKIFLCFILICSCNSSSDIDLTKLDGYWEIVNVKKDGELVMEYKMSPIIDYWQLSDDNSGFRKKVMPNLEGKIIVTQHSMPFKLMEEEQVTVNYNDGGNEYSEYIKRLEDSLLVIANKENLIYTYKRYKPMNLEDVKKE